MQINSLKLTNWRNFLNKTIDLASTTVLIGDNGRGKTNILEAIYFLATTKSFRTAVSQQVINWKNDFSRLEGHLKTAERADTRIELVVNRDPQRKFLKKAKINGAEKKLFNVLGVLKVVLFSPESMEIIYGSPALRRRYLDSVLAMTDRAYARTLLNFQKVLRSRNKLLGLINEGRASVDELTFWNQQLVIEGSRIILRRAVLVKFLNKHLAYTYQAISDMAGDLLRLKYLNGLIGGEKEYKQKEIQKKYAAALVQKQNREIAWGTTLVGPQRDEILFVLNDKNITAFGSRGEYRSAILATKMAEIEYLKEVGDGDAPVLLLDDVFSELDEGRRHQLAKIIHGIQAVITTTDLSHLEPKLAKEAKIVRL